MNQQELGDLNNIDDQVQIIKRAALELKNISGGIQAIDCNVQRILASVKMLEINVSDLKDVV